MYKVFETSMFDLDAAVEGERESKVDVLNCHHPSYLSIDPAEKIH